MRILHIITRLDMGGSAWALLQLAALQKMRGHEVTVAHGTTTSHQDGDFLDRAGVGVRHIPELVREVSPLKDVAAIFRVWDITKRLRPDVVHTHTSKAGFAGRIGARLAGCKCVVHSPHGHVFYGYFSPFVSGLFVLLERFAALFCDRLLPLTEAEAEEYARRNIAPREKTMSIPMGVPLDQFKNPSMSRDSMRLSLGLSPDDAVFGWIGRLDPVKDCGTFISSYKYIVKEIPGVKYLIVGDGIEAKALKEKAAVTAHGGIIMTGRRSDVACLLTAMDAMALTSLNEGFGIVIVEAMAAGVPVVATAVGGVPELVCDAGVLVPPGDPEALAQALVNVLKGNRTSKSLVAKGRKRAEDFSIENTERRLSRLYQDVLERKMSGQEKAA